MVKDFKLESRKEFIDLHDSEATLTADIENIEKKFDAILAQEKD